MTAGEIVTLAGYGVGALVLWIWARSRGLATEGMRLVALSGLGAGVVGARLTQWASVGWHPAMLDPRSGGKSIIGGLACGFVAVLLTKRKLGIRRSTGDGWALAVLAGEAVGRVGCFLNPCCVGTRWGGPFAVFQEGAWRHPAQLYSSASALLLLTFLLWLQPKLPREGDLFRVFVVLYGLSRFGIEFFRERPVVWHGLSVVQLVCLEVAVSGVLVWVWQWKWGAATKVTAKQTKSAFAD